MSVPTTELGDSFIVENYEATMAGVSYEDVPSGGAENRLHANKEIMFSNYTLVMDNEDVIFSAPKINMDSLIIVENGSSITFEDASINFNKSTWDSDSYFQGKIIFSGDSKLNLTSESNKLLIICNDISGTITLDLDDSFISGSTFSIQANAENNLIINNADGYEVIPTTDGTITTYTVNRVSSAKEIKQITLGEETYLLKDETARNGLKDKQDLIPDLYTIREGARKGETAVQPYELNDYATTQALTDGLATKQPIGDYATKQELNGKQDTIPDLTTIRTGAEKGSTAVQPNQLSAVATSGSYNDLTNKPTIPTKTSELQNDSEFITIASLSGYATQDWVQSLGYITGITSSDVTTALGYTPLRQSDLSPYAKTEIVQGWLRSKQDKLTAGEGITIDDDNVISATGGGGGGDVVEAISGQSIYPYEIVMTREWENPYRMQNVYLGGDFGLAVDDVLELPEASFSKSFNISNSERETEFTISSMNDRYDSYFRFNSNQLYIDLTDKYGNMRNLTISLRYGTVYYADSERGDFELDLYDVMNTLNNLING